MSPEGREETSMCISGRFNNKVTQPGVAKGATLVHYISAVFHKAMHVMLIYIFYFCYIYATSMKHALAPQCVLQ